MWLGSSTEKGSGRKTVGKDFAGKDFADPDVMGCRGTTVSVSELPTCACKLSAKFVVVEQQQPSKSHHLHVPVTQDFRLGILVCELLSALVPSPLSTRADACSVCGISRCFFVDALCPNQLLRAGRMGNERPSTQDRQCFAVDAPPLQSIARTATPTAVPHVNRPIRLLACHRTIEHRRRGCHRAARALQQLPPPFPILPPTVSTHPPSHHVAIARCHRLLHHAQIPPKHKQLPPQLTRRPCRPS
jgi:hypothetical protein